MGTTRASMSKAELATLAGVADSTDGLDLRSLWGAARLKLPREPLLRWRSLVKWLEGALYLRSGTAGGLADWRAGCAWAAWASSAGDRCGGGEEAAVSAAGAREYVLSECKFGVLGL